MLWRSTTAQKFRGTGEQNNEHSQYRAIVIKLKNRGVGVRGGK